MRSATLADDVDWPAFLSQAQAFVAHGVRPQDATFEIEGEATLFGAAGALEPGDGTPLTKPPREFVELGRAAALHKAADRFDLLYSLLFRLQAAPALMEIASDPEVAKLRLYAQSVRRDRHKMTAFVRFQEVEDDGPRFVAWFEPEHRIEENVASFFVDRYSSMRFAIHTPRRAILWDGARLAFGPGGRPDTFALDGYSAAWDVYYRSIFNPARLNRSAMLKEMPRKYWANLPEARQIPGLIAQAETRLRDFEATAGQATRRRVPERAPAPVDPGETLATCRRCELWRPATQAVAGEGPRDALIAFVGEQPGDHEDLMGKPFVGPAGEVFDAALRAAGLDRAGCYVTNAVKHFKHEPRGKKRLHRRPAEGEILACRPWLVSELAVSQARVIVALGSSAYFALTGERDYS